MNRREFLSAGAAGLGLSAKALAEQLADQKPKRVGIIGPGWYGKCDLFRLIQVSPVEVVSMCDVDKQMLSQAAEMVAARQASKKTPRLYGDYREMLKEKDLDICLVDTPDHWHALPMIAAVQSGADVWVQKPISVDVVEGQSMLAAARKYGRVVQVGTQRRSTPHLVEARDQIIRDGKLGKVGLVEIYSYGGGGGQDPPEMEPPANLDYEMWTGPAPMRPFIRGKHPQGWRQYMEYGNGDPGRHGDPHVRYDALVPGSGVAQTDQLFGRHPGEDGEEGEYSGHADGDLRLRRAQGGLAASAPGAAAGSEIPLGRDALRRQGNAQGGRLQLRLHPGGTGTGDPQGRDLRVGQVPRRQHRADAGKVCAAPATSAP